MRETTGGANQPGDKRGTETVDAGCLSIRAAQSSSSSQQLAEVRAALGQLAQQIFPDNWLDPLLTGPDAALGEFPYGCPDVERLIAALKKRFQDQLAALIATLPQLLEKAEQQP